MISNEADQALIAIADTMLGAMTARSAIVRFEAGLSIDRFDDFSEEAARKQARFAAAMHDKLASLQKENIAAENLVLFETLLHLTRIESAAHQFYWLGFEITPYVAHFRFDDMHRMLSSMPLEEKAHRQAYLRLAEDYARTVDDLTEKTTGQAERDIRLSRCALSGARNFFRGLIKNLNANLAPASERLNALDADDAEKFMQSIDVLVAGRVEPALSRLLETIGAPYEAAAPDDVGLAQYPQGSDYYRHLIEQYNGYSWDPVALHKAGLDLMEDLTARRAEVRKKLGGDENEIAFHENLKTDPRFIASGPDAVAETYEKHLARIEPKMKAYFAYQPKAKYAVKRAAPAIEDTMTFGYYEHPTPAHPVGYYRFNGSGLETRSQCAAAHLIYHELIPGHHTHIALIQEQSAAHPIFNYLQFSGQIEGWAEYAARLAGEMGMYEDLYDLYGHLLQVSFLTARIVVDTGMHALGWSLEEAQDYMRKNTIESDAQIATETIRYATDLPAQGLAYRMSAELMWRWREEIKAQTGSSFDIRDFHQELTANGSMPMPALEARLKRVYGLETLPQLV